MGFALGETYGWVTHPLSNSRSCPFRTNAVRHIRLSVGPRFITKDVGLRCDLSEEDMSHRR
eukprot:1454128-Pyramimonas_sp.AAC.1